MRIDREKLYQDIWKEPATIVAKRYGVSDVILGRICASLRVPKPPRGYWARRAAGRAEPPPPLPHALPGDEVVLGAGPAVPAVLSVHPRPRRTRLPKGHRSHPLVVEAREAFLNRRNPENGGYLVPRAFNVMDLFVTEGTLSRGLREVDRLFLELERRGHRVILGRGAYGHRKEPAPDDHQKLASYVRNHCQPTITFIGETAVGLTVYEVGDLAYTRWDSRSRTHVRSRHPSHAADTKHWMPNGRLALRAYAPYEGVGWQRVWMEAEAGTFATLVPEVISELEDAEAPLVHLVNEARRAAQAQRDEVARLHEEHQRLENARRAELQRQHDEQERSKRLLALVERWRTATDIRAFVADARSHGSQLGEDFLSWASAYADSVDPLRET